MAVRSGAGTGVIVSLVVFVIATCGLLVLAIMFHVGKTEAEESRQDAETGLASYVRPAEQNNDAFKTLEGQAQSHQQSVARYMLNRGQEAMALVDGDPMQTLEGLQTRASGFGAGEGRPLIAVLEEANRKLRNRDSELDNANELLSEKDAAIDDLQDEIERLRSESDRRVEDLRTELRGYIDAAKEYRTTLGTAVTEMEDATRRLEAKFEGRVDDLEDRNDGLNQEIVTLRQRAKELLNIVRTSQETVDPSVLVDARVIDVSGDDEIFIDRGRLDRLTLGMTFEVFDNADSMRVERRTDELPRGKASVQVTQVGEQTCRCKVVRGIAGRPVVRGDVLANAVYDPNYNFKFMVHGRFDINGDGRPSESEADHIRNKIIQWGGTVVTGGDLPGDLDFLVLGVEPPHPAPLPDGASDAMVAAWLDQREAVENYDNLFRRAREAQIPVLNSNRFFVLIGHTDN